MAYAPRQSNKRHHHRFCMHCVQFISLVGRDLPRIRAKRLVQVYNKRFAGILVTSFENTMNPFSSRKRDSCFVTCQFRYIKIQLKTKDLSTRLWGVTKSLWGLFPEPRAEANCIGLFSAVLVPVLLTKSCQSTSPISPVQSVNQTRTHPLLLLFCFTFIYKLFEKLLYKPKLRK